MPVSPKDNQEVRDARREQILHAATKVFSEKGLVASKISDIAKTAKLSHGLVYHYFESKEDVFAAIIERILADFRAQLEVEKGTPRERLEEKMRRAVHLTQERPEVGRLLSQAILLQSIPAPCRNAAVGQVHQIHRRWSELIAQCQKSGDVTTAVKASDLAGMLLLMFRGMAIRPPGVEQPPFPLPSYQAILALIRPSKKAASPAARTPQRGKTRERRSST